MALGVSRDGQRCKEDQAAGCRRCERPETVAPYAWREEIDDTSFLRKWKSKHRKLQMEKEWLKFMALQVEEEMLRSAVLEVLSIGSWRRRRDGTRPCRLISKQRQRNHERPSLMAMPYRNIYTWRDRPVVSSKLHFGSLRTCNLGHDLRRLLSSERCPTLHSFTHDPACPWQDGSFTLLWKNQCDHMFSLVQNHSTNPQKRA